MNKADQGHEVELTVLQQRLEAQAELHKYGDNALPILGLALFVRADDVEALAAEAITDGPDDKKIDFCHIDRTAEYAVIAQGHASRQWGKQAAPANKATDLIAAVGWLLSGDMAKVPEKLRAMVRDLRQAIQDGEVKRLDLLYIHNCQESDNVKNELRTAAQVAADLIKDKGVSVGYHELGVGELDSLCRASEGQVRVQEEFDIPASNVIEEFGGSWRSIVATMPGDWLHGLHTRNGNRLFSANYRDYLGVRNSAKNINYGIKTSVLSDPDNFWTYNNGITALVQRILKKNSKYHVSGISIINGAQTTGSVGECSPREAAKVKVVCRFVECTDREVLDKIIKFNNTQNAFRSSDQRSTEPGQRRLASEFQEYKINYVHRRSFPALPRNSVSAESVAPLLCAFHGDPQTATRRRNDIFDLDTIFHRVFPKSCTAEHVLLIHCLGLAVDEVKLALKMKSAAGKATTIDGKNYAVLDYSMSKLFFIGLMGAVAEEILLTRLPDRYAWRFKADVIRPDLGNLVFPWKEAVEAVLPIVASSVEDPYKASRELSMLPMLGQKVAATLNGLGGHYAPRFAPLKDATTW